MNGPVVLFENDYTRGTRRQLAKGGAGLDSKLMPLEAFGAKALPVGPVLREIVPAVLIDGRKGLLLLDAQGFLRYLTSDGRVEMRKVTEVETKRYATATP